MTKVTEYEGKWFILMKSGMVHFVSEETGRRMSNHLAQQSGHTFVKVKELNDISFNTAEMEGVYDHPQYVDLCRVKSGEWQCAYGRWHNKKGECRCKESIYMEEKRKKEKEKEEEENKSLTPEERKSNAEKIRKLNEMAALNGNEIFRSLFYEGRGREMRKSTIEEWERMNGRKANLKGFILEK